MGRSPCCEKVGLKKGPWTPEEDQKLLAYIDRYGHGSWRALPAKAGLQRCGKSCRLRWTNYLRPDIKRGKFSLQEEQTIIQLHALLGNRWSAIATHLPKRTDNEIKNYWNTHLKKRLTKMGIDPVTHKPKNNALLLGSNNNSQYSKDTANLNHMAQWENARLEAEARLVRESKVSIMSSNIRCPRLPPPPPPSSSSSVVLPVASPVPLKQPLMIPPCLDILKAWHVQWTTTTTDPNNNNNVLQLNSNFGSLESPTSVFNFSDYNRLQILHPNKPQEISVPPTRKLDNFLQSTNNNNNNKCPEKEMPTTYLHEFESFPVDDHHNHDQDEPCINNNNNSNIPEEDGPSFLEGFGEDLLSDHDVEVFNYNMIGFNDDNLGGCYNGYNLEDNNNYWNAIL